jgi:hypothetical protein
MIRPLNDPSTPKFVRTWRPTSTEPAARLGFFEARSLACAAAAFFRFAIFFGFSRLIRASTSAKAMSSLDVSLYVTHTTDCLGRISVMVALYDRFP